MASIGEFIVAIVALLVIVVPFIVVFGALCLLIGFVLWGMKKKTDDQMKMMYQEMLEEAVVNYQPNMVELVRYPAPFFGRIVDEIKTLIADLKVNKNIETSKRMEQLLGAINEVSNKISGQSAVVMGRIIGFNRFDLLATIEGILMPEGIEDQKLQELSAEKRATLDELIKQCGRYLNFIVYEKDLGGFLFFKRTYKQGVFAFDDQVMGMDSADGTVTLLGEGTTKIGIYFQIPSGYPERIQVLLTHLIETSRIRWAMLLESNLIEITEKSSNFDTQFLKIAELSTVQSSMVNKVKKE